MTDADTFAKLQEILKAPGHSIEHYRVSPPADLYPPSHLEPDFFKENLVSPNRVLKLFHNSPHANLRVFYFQLIRLAYELEESNNTFLNNLYNVVFHPEFEIFFTPETEPKKDELYNDLQFKKLFAQFLQILDRRESPVVEQFLNAYPVFDQIMIHILRTILANFGVDSPFEAIIDTNIVFSKLGELLGLSLTSYPNCWKFQDSDMFCYQDNEQELYLAYILHTKDTASSNEPSATESRPATGRDISTVPTIPSIPTEASNFKSQNAAPLEPAISPSYKVSQTYNNYQTPNLNNIPSPLTPSYAPFTATTSYTPGLPSYGDKGDYYQDFTDDRLLDILDEPYRTQVMQIKGRIKGLKRGGGVESVGSGYQGGIATSYSSIDVLSSVGSATFTNPSYTYTPVEQRFSPGTFYSQKPASSHTYTPFVTPAVAYGNKPNTAGASSMSSSNMMMMISGSKNYEYTTSYSSTISSGYHQL